MSTIWGQVWPQVFNSGQRVVVRVENIPDSTRLINAQLSSIDSVVTQFIASVPLELMGGGMAHGEFTFPAVARESAVYIDSVTVNGRQIRLPKVSFSICNPVGLLRRDDASVIMRVREIQESQRLLYQTALGDASGSNARQFRIAFLVEDLLITVPLSLPGVRILGIEERPRGRDAAAMTTSLVARLGWDATIVEEKWSAQFGHDHPISAIVFEQIFASDLEAAMEIAVVNRDNVLSLLALNRGARGRPVVAVVEAEVPDAQVEVTFRFEHPRYSGNLVGGMFSGENQVTFLQQSYSMAKHPLLKLCVDLYSEALSERSADAKYFRLWSVLETLAVGRVAGGLRVGLLDGTYWPEGLTTSRAAGRVYHLVADCVFRGPDRLDETSMVAPAGSLYEATKSWYARRNATAHYGNFRVDDVEQIGQRWYADALKTAGMVSDEWLQALQRLCAAVLSRELSHRSEGGN